MIANITQISLCMACTCISSLDFRLKRHQLAGSWDHYTDSNFREHFIIIALLPAIPLDRSMHGAVPFINYEWHHSLPACPSVVTVPARCAYCTHCVHYSLPTTCLLLLPQDAYCSHCACPMCLLYAYTWPVRYCANCTVRTTSSVPTVLTAPSVLTMPTMQWCMGAGQVWLSPG